MPWITKYYKSKTIKDLFLVDDFYRVRPLKKEKKSVGGYFKCTDCDSFIYFRITPSWIVRCDEHRKEHQRLYRRKYKENKLLKSARQLRYKNKLKHMNRKMNKLKHGFAALDPKRLALIASRGGKAAHERGTAHTWTSETAKAAGRLGGRGKRKTI